MMDFVAHLKESVLSGDLVLGSSKLQDWFSLLSLANLQDLSNMLEDLKNDKPVNVDYIVMLVYLLCQLEGFDLYTHYGDSPSDAVRDFGYMVSLEILGRQGFVRIHQKLSFTNPDDCHIELLKIPYQGFDLNLN